MESMTVKDFHVRGHALYDSMYKLAKPTDPNGTGLGLNSCGAKVFIYN